LVHYDTRAIGYVLERFMFFDIYGIYISNENFEKLMVVLLFNDLKYYIKIHIFM